MSLNKTVGTKCNVKSSLAKNCKRCKKNHENNYIKKSLQNNPIDTITDYISHLFKLIITKVSGYIYINMH